MPEPGLFISLEGIDGSGKSTQARMLADQLGAQGRDVVATREPGGAPGAEAIRRLLVEGDPARWSPETEILLFNAARRDQLERTIRPGSKTWARAFRKPCARVSWRWRRNTRTVCRSSKGHAPLT